jgi:hypothetical protein
VGIVSSILSQLILKVQKECLARLLQVGIESVVSCDKVLVKGILVHATINFTNN